MECLAGLGVAHLDEILTELGLVERPVGVSGPGQGFDDDSVEAQDLFVGGSGVVVVEA